MKNKVEVLPQNRFRWLYLAGFFLILALPLLNLPPWFSPPAWGKTIVFRIILSILIFFFVWQILSKKFVESDLIRRFASGSLAFWLLLALFGIYLISTIFSLDRNFSLWGSPYRSGGFLNFAFYIIFAILAFLILRKSDWQKIWDFSIVIGILVSVIAIFQFYGSFSKIFISSSWRPASTVGGATFLAIYLSLLSFLTLSFGIQKKNFKRKVFYFFAFLLFLFVIIFLAKTRAVYIGIATGFLWFLFFYPKKATLIKVFAGLLLILGILGLYFLKNHPEVYTGKNKLLQTTIDRILSVSRGNPARISALKVSFEAMKARPILGYGPENFSIGFDKYYDPALPGIETMPGTTHSWWDRAHNFIFDISLTAGIPALIIYLSLFGVLFWQLQKLKNANVPESGHESTPIVAHGIQAAFIAYLTANLFSFDTFSSYLISFLLIAFSLSLLSKSIPEKTFSFNVKGRAPIILLLFVGIIWFIWNFNIKPFQVNTEINVAVHLSEEGKCEPALVRMEKILPEHSILDNYLRLRYINVIRACIEEKPEMSLQLSQKATEILKENIKIRPYYVRNWILLESFTNILIEKNKNAHPEVIPELKKEANECFSRAYELSPERDDIFIEGIKTNLLTGEYQKAKEKAQECINLNPTTGYCWWLMGLTYIYLDNPKEAENFTEVAKEKGYDIQSESSLLQLSSAYVATKNYQELSKVYQKLIEIKPNQPQYHASLATCYRELGNFEKAKKEALKVLELQPEARIEIEKFLESLIP